MTKEDRNGSIGETVDGVLLLTKLARNSGSPTSAKQGKTQKVAAKRVIKSNVSKAVKPSYPWLKKYPEDIKWDMKIAAKPAYELLEEAISQVPNSNCIDFLGKKLTYSEVGNLVNKMAKGLQELGVKKGVKVGIFMPNASYFPIAYYAILKAGGDCRKLQPALC